MVKKGKVIVYEEKDLKNITIASKLTGRKAEGFIRHFSRIKAEEILKKYHVKLEE